MRKLQLTNKTYQEYKETVKGNETTSRKQAELKMTRNMQLAHKSKRAQEGEHYKYGCLHFIVAKGKVVWIQNNNKPEKGWKKDIKRYLELNKELGIESDETYIGLWLEMKIAKIKYLKNKMKWKLKLAFK